MCFVSVCACVCARTSECRRERRVRGAEGQARGSVNETGVVGEGVEEEDTRHTAPEGRREERWKKRVVERTVGQLRLSAVGELVGLPWRRPGYSLGSGPPQRETPIREIRGVAEPAAVPEV
ncbi:hypothetical protein KM043_017464 [Ampulex compressa]|nr:hypothetical protein KM043_017464 [Ampulex compressa]